MLMLLGGRVGKPNSTILKGWRCRDCGSWDVYVAVIEERSGSGQGTFEQRVQETLNLGVQDKVSCGQGHLNVDSRARMGVHKFI